MPSPMPRARRAWEAALLLASLAFLLLWIGDIPWQGDEAALAWAAIEANDAGRPVLLGLEGTRGARYGPVPLWFYQLAYAAAASPVAVAAIKAASSGCLCLAAGLRLAVALRLPLWPAILLLVPPYMRFYHRASWDNVFLLPLSLALAASLASYLRSGRPGWMLLGAGAAVAALHTHLMSLPVVAAWALALIAFGWRRVAARPGWAAAAAAAAAAACAPYAAWLAGGGLGAEDARPPGAETPWEALAGAFSGLFFSGGHGFVDYFTPEFPGAGGWPPALLFGLEAATLAGPALSCAGLATAAARLWRKAAAGRPPSAFDGVGAFCLAAAAAHAAVCLALRLPAHPHYANAVWPAFLVPLWALCRARRWRAPARAAMSAHIAACAALGLAHAACVHRNAGFRSHHYGTSLGEQWRAARALAESAGPRTPVRLELPPERPYARQLSVLTAILRRQGVGPPEAPARMAVVSFAGGPPSARLAVELRRGPGGPAPPPGGRTPAAP